MKTHGIKANFAFNVGGTIAPLIIALVTMPIYVSHIGAARYGVVSITWILLGYFGFLDLGLSRATANALAKLRPSSSERAKIFLTSFYINLFLGAIGGLVLYSTGMLIMDRLVRLPAELKPEIEAAIPWIACLLPLALVSGVGNGALESRERFLAVNILQMVGMTVGQVIPALCAVFISPSLAFVIPAAVVSRSFSILLVLGFVARQEWPLDPRNFDWKQCRKLLGYGSWVSVSNIIGPILTSLDQMVIGSTLGLTAVTHYSVPMSLVGRSQILAAALSRTLFPRMSRSNWDEARDVAEKAFVMLAFGYGAVSAAAIILARPFLVLWMGQDFALVAAPIAELLLIGGWVNGLAFLPFALLQGQGRPDITAKFHALELIPFVFILWFLAKEFGLIGAAAAWVLRCAADGGFLFATARFQKARLRTLLVPFAFILGSFLLLRFVHLTLLDAFLAAALFGGGLLVTGIVLNRSGRDFALSLRFGNRSLMNGFSSSSGG